MDCNKDSTFYNYPKRPLQSKSAAAVSAEDNSNKIVRLHMSVLQQGVLFWNIWNVFVENLQILQELISFSAQDKTFTAQYLSKIVYHHQFYICLQFYSFLVTYMETNLETSSLLKYFSNFANEN